MMRAAILRTGRRAVHGVSMVQRASMVGRSCGGACSRRRSRSRSRSRRRSRSAGQGFPAYLRRH